jgi:L-ribulose-5-phosphate 4-epimerase
MADEFGGEIPVGPFALIGNDDIGQGIVQTLCGSRSGAVLIIDRLYDRYQNVYGQR